MLYDMLRVYFIDFVRIEGIRVGIQIAYNIRLGIFAYIQSRGAFYLVVTAPYIQDLLKHSILLALPGASPKLQRGEPGRLFYFTGRRRNTRVSAGMM